MAKFQDKHLKLRYDQRAFFGDADDCSIWHDGIQLRVSCTVSGVDPTQDYHLVTKHYVDTTASGRDEFIELLDTPSSYTGYGDYLVTVKTDESGLEFTAVSGINGIIDHGLLQGLLDDDHPQYVPRDGSRGFTATVSGVYPTLSYHLATKQYVDDAIATLSGSIVIDHGSLLGLLDDDHPQYVPCDGSRGFTATVSGVYPTQSYHLTTKQYVDERTIDHECDRVALALNDDRKTVTFTNPFVDTNYSLSVLMRNTVDASPSIYPMIITSTTISGFTVLFSGDIDSNNYYLEYIAAHDE